MTTVRSRSKIVPKVLPIYYKNDSDFVKLLPEGKLMKISFFKNNVYISYSSSQALADTITTFFKPCKEEEFNEFYQRALHLINKNI